MDGPDLDGAAHTPPAIVAQAHYGGPDRPPGALRDLLKARIDAAPAGSEILWVTYYFRDRGLAETLAAAQRRGVRVRVILDAKPRRAEVNSPVIGYLRGALGDGLRLHRPLIRGPRLHAKIYAFLGASPAVFVGSFNPSGDQPEDPAILADIGDQDRGHNLLVEYRDPAVVAAVGRQAARIWEARGVSRFSPSQNRAVPLGQTTLYFYPRLRPGVVERSLADLGPDARVRAAVSHLGSGSFAAALGEAARRGARVEVIVHDTRRRVPRSVVRRLAEAGVAIRRYCHPEGLPMHAKFIVVARPEGTTAWFGSLNYNFNSQWLNQEILIRSRDPALVAQLDGRFGRLTQEAVRLAQATQGQALAAADAARPAAAREFGTVTARFTGTASPAALAPDRACDA